MRYYLCLIFTLCAVSQAAHAANDTGKTSLVVLTPEISSPRAASLAEPFVEALKQTILASGSFVFKDPRSEKKIFKEKNFSAVCGEQDCAMEAGKLLGVDKVIAGAITKTGATCYLRFILIDVATAKLEEIREDKGACDADEVMRAGKNVVSKLLGLEAATRRTESAQENSRFAFAGLIATDRETRLVWTRDADTANKTMTLDEASEFLKRLNKDEFDGRSDWRLPTREEFAALAEYAKSHKAKMSLFEALGKVGFKNVRPEYYWTSTSDAEVSGLTWMLDMYIGKMTTGSTAGAGYVWPISSGRASRRDAE